MDNKEKTDAEILMEHFRENYSYEEMCEIAIWPNEDDEETEQMKQHAQVMKAILARMYDIEPSKYIPTNNNEDKEN